MIAISEKDPKRYLVTSALPYVHGLPHLGNLVGSILPADVYARYQKLKKRDCIYICGSDQHGTSFEVEAFKRNIDVKKFAMDSHFEVEELLKKYNFDFDFYGYTHSKMNELFTDDFFLKNFKNDNLIEKETKQAYCKNDKMFLADRWIEGKCPKCNGLSRGDQCNECGTLVNPEELIEPYCVHCGKKDIEFKTTKNMYLDLAKFSPELKKWISSHKEWPDIVLSNSLSLIEQGLQERAITRDIKWGFPVPHKGYEDKVFYVWFDAPIGYISFTAEWAEMQGHKDKWKDYWQSDESKLVQFMGKDNWIFHSIIFPAMMLGTKESWHLPDYLAVSAFLNAKGFKFSKSLGVGLNMQTALEIRDADYWRYVLMSLYPEKHDSEFSLDVFAQVVNTELADVFGNLTNRTLVFINNNFENKVPELGELDDRDEKFKKEAFAQIKKIENAYENVRMREAVQETIAFARLGNVYLQEKEPWKIIKTNKAAAATTLNLLVNFIRSLAIVSEPIMPTTSEKIWNMLELKGTVRQAGFDSSKEFVLPNGHKLAKAEILFMKIDDKELVSLKERFSSSEKKSDVETKKDPVGLKLIIKYDDFAKLDIKVGTIKTAEEVVKSDKLIKLMIDCREGKLRQIVAGIKSRYKPESLVGSQVIVLCNLEPRKLAGVESQGMLLAAGGKENFVLLRPEKSIDNGSEVG